VCAGVSDALPGVKRWTAVEVAGLPILLVRDADGSLRGFLNVCRHRASPLCDSGTTGEGTVIRCPYHSWIYRLDGSLALDLGPLAKAIDAFPIESFETALTESHVRPFNWKVLLENYSENYHTPYVHPEIDTSSSEDYPMVSDGPVLYAWDRLRAPSDDPGEQVRASLLPGEPGWEGLASARADRPYDVGSYLTVWPNAMINVFPDAALIMWMEPLSATTTRVERRLLLAPGRDPAAARAIVETHRLVHQQDVDICSRVQRSHTAGLDADGVLATVEERGVYFVHEQLRRCLAADGRNKPSQSR
jgi:phenylpropionate dioxygenase-like ring-hydroxylating dioxygenase large terminal subunit